MHKFRIAFVNTHPIQYFAPLYAYLNQTGEFAVTALYLSDFSVRGSLDRAFGRAVKWDIDLLSGYDVRFVKGAGLRDEPEGFFSIIAPQIWHEVSRGGFDALVVHGHTPAAALIAARKASIISLPSFPNFWVMILVTSGVDFSRNTFFCSSVSELTFIVLDRAARPLLEASIARPMPRPAALFPGAAHLAARKPLD